MTEPFEIHCGHALAVLRTLPDESVDCVVTSIPYWGLRDYGTEHQIWGGNPKCRHKWDAIITPAANGIKHPGGMSGESLSTRSATRGPRESAFCARCGAWKGELGLEPTVQLFVEHIVEIFREIRRVLKRTGTVWVNVGDTYAGSWGGQGGPSNLSVVSADVYPHRSPANKAKRSGLKPKDRCMIPARVAIAMQEDGWWLRDEIVWSKPNPMPSSVRDRTSPSHEMIYMFSKSRRYWFDKAAIAEPAADASLARWDQDVENQEGSGRAVGKTNGKMKAVGGKPLPSGWENSPNYSGQDPRYPGREPKLPDTFKGSIPGRKDGPGQDRRSKKDRNLGPKNAGADPSVKATASARMGRGAGWRNEPDARRPMRAVRSVWEIATQPYKKAHFATFPIEIPRRCILAGCPEGGTVLDPFAGSGTTLAVAVTLGRRAIGIELNPEYIDLMNERMIRVTPSLFLEAS